jgi:hypothetical protein
VPVLGDQQLVGLEHAADQARDLAVRVVVAAAGGHVGDVDAPAVEPLVEPAARDRGHPPPQLRALPVQLRQRRDAHPGRVAVPLRLVEVEEPPLLARRVGLRGAEPVVALAAVVERQVADDAEAAPVGGAQERAQRLVAAEQRVDAVEARGVVAVGRAGGEERRQVEHVRAESLDVVEVRLDAAEVAAEPLVRRRRVAAVR